MLEIVEAVQVVNAERYERLFVISYTLYAKDEPLARCPLTPEPRPLISNSVLYAPCAVLVDSGS